MAKTRQPIKLLTITILSDGQRIISEMTRANGMKDELVIEILEQVIANFKSRNGKASK